VNSLAKPTRYEATGFQGVRRDIMGEVEQLMKRIQNLAPRDFAEFRSWFLDFDARVWDRQIEADVKAGKLDGLVAEALADYKAGKAREL
jgi:hypothetical protein